MVSVALGMYCFISDTVSQSTWIIRWAMLLIFTLGGDIAGPPSYEYIFKICKPSHITMICAFIAIGGYFKGQIGLFVV